MAVLIPFAAIVIGILFDAVVVSIVMVLLVIVFCIWLVSENKLLTTEGGDRKRGNS
jgi:hypothetical protein